MPAIATHHTATSEGAWDGPANEARARSGESRAYYARIFAWRDPEGDDSVKASYRFIHHEVSGDGDPGAANIRGCQTGIGVLNGGRGGTTIPASDRRGVYNHLAAHLRDADVEPPDLRALPHVVVSETGVERRFVTAEIRVVDGEDGQAHIRGYGAVFNQWGDLGFFRELVEPGAFQKTLEEADVRSLWNHNPDYVLGRNRSGTLTLSVDERGLGYDVVPPDTQWARDLLVSIRRGDVNQSSFGFDAVRDVWGQNEEGQVTRRLVEVRLWDVGPVTFPAYPQTSAEARARVREWEQGSRGAREQNGGSRTRLEQEDTSAPGQGAHPEGGADADDVQGRVDLRRRRVELAEIYFVGGDG